MNKLTKVEKQYAAATFEGIKGVDFNNPELRLEIRKSMKKVAYHEAGHFAARLFTQLEFSHVLKISIIGNADIAGYVRSERNFTELSLDSNPPPLIQSNGRLLLLMHLAGYGVETILDESDEWDNIVSYYNCNHEDDYDNEGSDFSRALKIAGIMTKPFMPINRIINLADKWTLEMLKIPAVWNKVEIVAAKLIKQGEIKEDELDDLLFDKNFPTCYHLPKWKQRLLPKPGELEKYIERA